MESSNVATRSHAIEFKHTQLDHGTSSIRLVEILPALSDRYMIQCRVSHHKLTLDSGSEARSVAVEKNPLLDDGNAPPSYRCLSYTWGDPQGQVVIVLNGMIFWVRQNLHAFLSLARRTISETYLWIDALCIDQSNTTERNHQVQQMGMIYSKADTVLVWLGNDWKAAEVLLTINGATFESTPDAYADLMRSASLWMSRPMTDLEHDSLPRTNYWGGSHRLNLLKDTTGKVEKLFEPLISNDYWSRAWVTQEVLLSQHTVVLAGVEAHGLRALANIYRSSVHYHTESAFENIIDVMFRKADKKVEHYPSSGGLKKWGLVNLLHRFRYKECAVRRDRVYSLLALSKEAEVLKVDYDIPEEQILRQVLSLRESSICLCSTAVVAHALSPWNFDPADDNTDKPFARINMYASVLGPRGCPFCSNWVPSAWKTKDGLVFCLGTVCPDTQGHFFWERNKQEFSTHNGEDNFEVVRPVDLVHQQIRRNNRSKLLCKEGAGILVTRSEWKHVYLVQFTFRTLIELLLHEQDTGDMGLNACANLWPSEGNRQTSGEGRLRLCDEQ